MIGLHRGLVCVLFLKVGGSKGRTKELLSLFCFFMAVPMKEHMTESTRVPKTHRET